MPDLEPSRYDDDSDSDDDGPPGMPLPAGYNFMMSHIANARVDFLINDSNTESVSLTAIRVSH